jgi:hypothetical protein
MIKRYVTDYTPESELFAITDLEEQIVIVISKEQLKALIQLYKICCEGYNDI